MATATITTKGQITLPKAIRDLLRVQPGDRVDFVVADGEVRVRAGHVDVAALQGLLRRTGRKAVSLEQMDAAIRRARTIRP